MTPTKPNPAARIWFCNSGSSFTPKAVATRIIPRHVEFSDRRSNRMFTIFICLLLFLRSAAKHTIYWNQLLCLVSDVEYTTPTILLTQVSLGLGQLAVLVC